MRFAIGFLAGLVLMQGLDRTALAFTFEDLGLCEDRTGKLHPIYDLVCESAPALIEASNPGLNIPSCRSTSAQPQVLPEHLPVSSVFVTCRADNEDSCTQIASELVNRKTGATVNVLINREMLTDSLVAKLKKLRETAGASESPFNIIPVSVPVGVYMRDPGVLAREKNKSVLIANPHINGGFLGEPLLAELANACGFEFERSAAHLAKFDAAYEMLVNPRYQADGTGGPPEIRAIKTAKDHVDTGAELYGGNFMALPGGTLIVGEQKNGSSPDPEILSYFNKRQKVMKVELPPLYIGHVDEVFRIVPTQDACGFAILYASPAEMVKFLHTRPKEEIVVRSDDLFAKPYEKNPALREKFKTLSTQIATIQEQKKEIPQSLRLEFQRASEEFGNLVFMNLTAGDLLSDRSRIKRWLQSESLIRDQLKRIVSEIKETTPSHCEPKALALPMAWNQVNSPLLPNPVNALTVNGTYFHSTPNRAVFGNPLIDFSAPFQSGRREEKVEAYAPFEKYVHERLKPLLGNKIVSVNTRRYDEGNGNFHCATLNNLLPCK